MQPSFFAEAAHVDDTQHLARRIYSIVAINGLAAIAVVAGFVVWMADAVDALARTNAQALLQSALQAELESVALSTADYALWDAPFEWIAAGDTDALYDNFGSGATISSTFDFIYVLNGTGQPIYGYQSDGTQSDLSIIDANLTSQIYPRIVSEDPSNSTVVTSYHAKDGDIVAVAGTRIRPDDLGDLTSLDLPVMIAGTRLTAQRLEAVSARLLLRDVSIHNAQDTLDAHRTALSVLSESGTPIAQLSWINARPSEQLLASALPIILGMATLTFLATLLIGRISATQTTAYLRQRHLARTDKLTGLPNRAGLDQILKSEDVAKALETGELAVAYLDLNDFKKLNDREGHDAGDLALQIFAERVRSALRSKDSVIRLGGDEFVCILLDESPGQTAEQVTRRIIANTAPPVRIGDTAHAISPSIGVAIGAPGANWPELLRNADIAMYHAKKSKTFQPVFYAPGMSERHSFRHALAG